ncbi:MAG: hypothetical protein RL553_1095 [Planctomycetota bacterium]|jgi:hypothetical protein
MDCLFNFGLLIHRKTKHFYRRKLRSDFLRALEEPTDSTAVGASAVFISSVVATGLVAGTMATEPPDDLPLRKNLPPVEAEQLPEAQELATEEELEAEHTPPAHSAPATAWPKPIARIKLIIKTS